MSIAKSSKMELPAVQLPGAGSRYILALVLFFLMFTLSLGYFNGQSVADERRDLGNMLIICFTCFSMLLIVFQVGVKFNFRYSSVIYTLLLWLFVIAFFRKDLTSSVKNFMQILLTEALVIFAANLFWHIPFNKLINCLLILLQLLMMTCLFVQLTKIGPLSIGNHIPEARFGGLYFYGETGVIAGLGAILSSFKFFSSRKGWPKMVYLLSFLLFSFYTLASDMRTVLAAIAVGVLLQYLFNRRARRKTILPVLLLAALFAGLYAIYNANTKEDADLQEGIEGREQIWKVSDQMIAEQPVFGYGNYAAELNNFSNSVPEFYGDFMENELSDPHSAFRSLILQSGFVSLFIFLIFIAKIFLHIKRYGDYRRALLSILFFWLICGFTGGTFFDHTYTVGALFFQLSILGILLHPDLDMEYPLAENEDEQ